MKQYYYPLSVIFSNGEQRAKLTTFVKNSSSLIWEIAREDGEVIADVG